MIDGGEDVAEEVPFMGCLLCEVCSDEGSSWETVPRRSGKPLPVNHTLGLHLERAINMKNQFKALELESESGSEATTNTIHVQNDFTNSVPGNQGVQGMRQKQAKGTPAIIPRKSLAKESCSKVRSQGEEVLVELPEERTDFVCVDDNLNVLELEGDALMQASEEDFVVVEVTGDHGRC